MKRNPLHGVGTDAEGHLELLRVTEERASALAAVVERLLSARHVVLTTHLNADGDGTGSQAAVAAWLEERGIRATIINPTPFPELYRWMLHRPDIVAELGTPAAESALNDADLFVVVDTSEPSRVGALADRLPRSQTVVLDHHPPGPSVVGDHAVQDTAAAAAGELIYDLIAGAGGPWPEAAVSGIYVAIVTDTGSFRFSNTTPRAHAIAADLLGRGIDPEAVYRRLYATVPRRQVELLRLALETLRSEEDAPVTWLLVTQEMAAQTGARADDFDGLIEHARSLEGSEIAILFRETAAAETKISLRSNGTADVNQVARRFGGGGHVKAAGAVVAAPAAEVIPQVLSAARAALAARE